MGLFGNAHKLGGGGGGGGGGAKRQLSAKICHTYSITMNLGSVILEDPKNIQIT